VCHFANTSATSDKAWRADAASADFGTRCRVDSALLRLEARRLKPLVSAFRPVVLGE
jgi:hypothetical protein